MFELLSCLFVCVCFLLGVSYWFHTGIDILGLNNISSVAEGHFTILPPNLKDIIFSEILPS